MERVQSEEYEKYVQAMRAAGGGMMQVPVRGADPVGGAAPEEGASPPASTAGAIAAARAIGAALGAAAVVGGPGGEAALSAMGLK